MKLHVIDYGHNADLPASVRSAIPDDATQTVFRTALNRSLGQGKSEMHAFLLAWKALKEAGYGEDSDGKWVKKEQPTGADVHVDAPMAGKKPKRKDAPGTDSPDIAEFEQLSKRISGSSDISLNPKGEALAEKLGKRLAAKGGLDVLHASPLARAQQTADCIEKNAAPAGSIQRAKPDPNLQPWHMGDMEGKSGGDVKDLIKHYVTHPDEVPPGTGADGKPGESFHSAVSRQLQAQSGIYQDSQDHPTAKIGVVVHSRGMEITKGWVDDGQPDDFEVDPDDMLKPDDPEHASVSRWHNGKIDDVDLDSDDPLKGGVYLIMHSLTDDDTDEGSEDLQKVHTYLPPAEVAAAAKRAWDAGIAVLDITAPLAEGTGIGLAEVRKVAAHFADSACATELATTRDAWGGPDAAKWAGRILRKHESSAASLNLLNSWDVRGNNRDTKADWYAEGSIVKVDDSQHLVFGWASITEVGGKTVTDTQDDQITEQTIEDSAYDFMLHARVAGEMHEQRSGEPVQVGAVVESMVFTHEKVAALLKSLRDQRIQASMDLGCVGWWVGFKIADPATWARVTSGELKAFSVGGSGKRQKVAA